MAAARGALVLRREDDGRVVCERVLVADSTVHRFETSFVKRQVKFEPFVPLEPVSLGD